MNFIMHLFLGNTKEANELQNDVIPYKLNNFDK